MTHPAGLGRALIEVMAEVRNARAHHETVEAVDQSLRELCERARVMETSKALTSALDGAEAAFHAGDTVGAIQHLSRALLETERIPPPKAR